MISITQLIQSEKLKWPTQRWSRRDVLAGRICFDRDMSGECYLGGWGLLYGVLTRRGGDYDARLYFDLGAGFVDGGVRISASRKGVIDEVVWLPGGVRRLSFSPMGGAGEFELSGLSLRKITGLERIWHMAQRVVVMCFLHARNKRRVLRLSPFRLFFDLKGAYAAASKLRTYVAAPNYADWIRQFDTLDERDRRGIKRHIEGFSQRPHFEVLLDARGASRGALQRSLESVRNQLYQEYTCSVLAAELDDSVPESRDAGALGRVSAVAQEQLPDWLSHFNARLSGGQRWVLWLRAGDELSPAALYRFAHEASQDAGVAAMYSDDDALDGNGERCKPRFKPDFSLAYLRSADFIGDALALRGRDVAAAGGLDVDACRYGGYDLLLRVLDLQLGGGVRHIASVLLHTTEAMHQDRQARRWCMAALKAHLARAGVGGEVSELGESGWRVRYSLPESPPLVSIIVPTRDGLELIRTCLDSVLGRTTYPRFEVLVVDNQSSDPAALAYLEHVAEDVRVQVLRYDLPFNYSAINNMAVRAAAGEVVCLLNNDTEVISPDWLEELVGQLSQPRVGAVGAKLYFKDGSVQHAGDLIGVGGVANHAHSFLARDDGGYCGRAAAVQELSAVTAACLATWREVYLKLGGLDEKRLKVAFNDVDYCLRLRAAGYRVVWTPHAELYHYESVSRGKDTSPAKRRRARGEAAYMRRRWKRELQRDPFYNPNLSHERADFSLSHAPVLDRPWNT